MGNLTSDSYNQELFDHMQDEHDLILLHSEMREIELICNKEIKSQIKDRDEKIKALNETIEKIQIDF